MGLPGYPFNKAMSWSHLTQFSDFGDPSKAGTLSSGALTLGRLISYHTAQESGSHDAHPPLSFTDGSVGMFASIECS